MKILLAIAVSLILLAIATMYILGYLSKSGAANGLLDGRLTRCPDTPNCVCSEFETGAVHAIEPLVYAEDDSARTLERLKETVDEMGGVVQAENETYLAATFTSSIFGFVDDLEIRIDAEKKLIHLRSASRVGYSDGDVNRKRLERLKGLFDAKSG